MVATSFDPLAFVPPGLPPDEPEDEHAATTAATARRARRRRTTGTPFRAGVQALTGVGRESVRAAWRGRREARITKIDTGTK